VGKFLKNCEKILIIAYRRGTLKGVRAEKGLCKGTSRCALKNRGQSI